MVTALWETCIARDERGDGRDGAGFSVYIVVASLLWLGLDTDEGWEGV